jgi:hypothetical protein
MVNGLTNIFHTTIPLMVMRNLQIGARKRVQ